MPTLSIWPDGASYASNLMDRVVAAYGEHALSYPSLPPHFTPLCRIETPADASHLRSTIACFFAAFFQPKYGPVWYVARTSFLRVFPQFPVQSSFTRLSQEPTLLPHHMPCPPLPHVALPWVEPFDSSHRELSNALLTIALRQVLAEILCEYPPHTIIRSHLHHP